MRYDSAEVFGHLWVCAVRYSPASVRRKWRSGVYVCRADVEDVSRCDRVVKAMQENRALFIFVRATPTKFLNIVTAIRA